jgi:thymidylate synthase
MLYQLVLVDSNNYIQTFESEDIQIINTQTSIKGDSYTVAFKELKHPFIIVQKMISNQTNKKINFSKNLTIYDHFVSPTNIYYKFLLSTKIDLESEQTNLKQSNLEELNYLQLMEDSIIKGDYRSTRNGNTYSLFGKSLEFDIQHSFPLLTTKKVFFRGIIEELLFFLHGKTDSKILEQKSINIWKPNTTKEFIASRKLNYREGDMGPMYGFNWLHFGAKYEGCDSDYTGVGFNQLEMVLKLLKEDPTSRRIMMTTYNPMTAEEGVLYPCHGIVVQFYVNIQNDSNDIPIHYVSCSMTQRSADIACGVPYNIASYAALVCIICKYLGSNYKPDRLIINLGDVHLYEEHIREALIQIKREPKQFPKLEINKFEKIEELTYEHFNLIDYNCHEPIKFVMKA